MRISKVFDKHFEGIDQQSLQYIIAAGSEVNLKTGEYLFHQNDPADLLYILISGRLRAIKKTEDDSIIILGDIGIGEPVGEFAFFTKEPRMASVLAIRDSTVLKIDNQSYLDLVTKHPELSTSLIQFIIKRLKRNIFDQKKTSPPKNIALLNLQSNQEIFEYTNLLKQEFQKLNISIKFFDSHDAAEDVQNAIFEKSETHDFLNIMICNSEHKTWTNKCLVYADLILVATPFYANHELSDTEKELNLYQQTILNKKTYLLLLHPENGEFPHQTSRWLKDRRVDLHLHLRKNNEKDARRLCRILTHKAVGLVLGGGGAKGFAHIGAVKAMHEKDIEIDFLGGTSAGALYGIGMSFADFEFEKIHALNQEAVRRKLTSNDITLPLLSMMSGKKFKKYLKETLLDYEMEDLWTNSFAVSTNFSKAQITVHTTGLLWQKILASMAIPGIFPPVVIDKNLHVDGGVMDNLPIEPMYQFPVDTIIAISLSTLEMHEITYKEAPTSWALAWDKVSRKKKFKIPGISSIIINSLVLNSQQKQDLSRQNATHFIQLNLKGIGMLDDKKWQEILDKGYQQTLAYFNKAKL